ncbi:MAG: aminopeptidase P family protein [Bacteroidota bacterium]|nr:aminopeptidase P family protein [Bacteroidota bacterium]
MNKEDKDFHASRRKEFSKIIGNDSMAIIFGSTHYNKSYDENFHFKQCKNFYYLTGFKEPNSALILVPSGTEIKSGSKEKSVKEILYVQKKDSLMETWTGKRVGFENVQSELGIQAAEENPDLKKILTWKFFTKYRRLYVNFGEMIKLSGEMKEIITSFLTNFNEIAPNIEIIDASFILGKLRAVKTQFEIKKIRKACDISVMSYNEIVKIISPGLYEYQVQAALEYNYKYNGSEESAYSAIVAGGENACILHYENNDQLLKNGELLLIDSGAEYNYYCSDITRTFPINGKFSNEQRLIYDIVLKANKECIKKIKPGVKFSEIKDLSEKILAEGLRKTGILKNKKEIKSYSMHGIGHHLGLDTHDAVASEKTLSEDNDVLRNGNVLTIEPGLYFPTGSKGIPKKYWGIGIRIEDDILVIEGGSENLTKAMVKEAVDIESLMKN